MSMGISTKSCAMQTSLVTKRPRPLPLTVQSAQSERSAIQPCGRPGSRNHNAMHINWITFTPWTALTGGLLIGLASVALILLNGRIAGISGILGELLIRTKGDMAWRIAFLLGLMASPWVYPLFAPLPAMQVGASDATLLIAGLLVGLGTRYGSGCTSGHGVCGLSRLSLRSLVATLAFMATGFATVFVVRHLIQA